MLYDKIKANIINSDGSTKESSSYLVREHKFDLYVNNQFYCSFTCINSDIDKLILGRLYCEGFEVTDLNISSAAHAKCKKINKPTCMLDTSANVFPLVECFMKNQEIHKFTSGTHSCIVAINGKIDYIGEDIGRHNVIDKAIGHIVKTKADMSKSEIFTSARVSTSLVEKCINAGIKSLITKSVCTSEAAELARNKINLICKAWPDSYEVYY